MSGDYTKNTQGARCHANLTNINGANVPFLCAGGRGMPVPATITEQKKYLDL